MPRIRTSELACNLRDAADFFCLKTMKNFREATPPGDLKHFFHGKLSPAAAHRHYGRFIRLCADIPGKDADWLRSASRGFAQRLATIMVLEAKLDDYVALASRAPFFGFPSPDEVLHAHKQKAS